MASDEFGEKTEEASERRREDERRRGHVPRSGELSTSSHLLTYAVIFYMFGATFVAAMGSMLVTLLSTAHTHNGTRPEVQAQFKNLAIWAAENVLPWLGAMIVAGVAVNLGQVGFLLATEKLTPNLNLLNPVTGLKKVFSIQSVVTLAFSLCKLTMLMSVVYFFMMSRLPQILSLSNEPVSTAFAMIGNAVVELSLLLAVILLIIGGTDFGFQKWKY